jgi:hypothetical protein
VNAQTDPFPLSAPATKQADAIPPGVRLFFQDKDARPCEPEKTHLWCYEGAKTWYYPRPGLAPRWAKPDAVPVRPVPPWVVALRPDARVRPADKDKPTSPLCCKKCGPGRPLRLVNEITAAGKPRLKVECCVCGKYVAYQGKPPGNLNLEYRTADIREESR